MAENKSPLKTQGIRQDLSSPKIQQAGQEHQKIGNSTSLGVGIVCFGFGGFLSPTTGQNGQDFHLASNQRAAHT